MYSRILVPLDGTAFGDHALPYAIAIARRTGATLELAHVHRRIEDDSRLTGLPQFRYERVENLRRRDDEEALRKEDALLEERAADIELRFGVPIIARVLRGTRARALTDEAVDTVADLVVMSSHARSGLPRLRHGDLAHELVGRLNIPTLCIHPPVDADPALTGEIRRILVTLDGSDFSEQILDMAVPLAKAIDARLALMHVVSPASLMINGFSDLQRPIPHREEALEYLRHVADRMRESMRAPELVAAEAGAAAGAIIEELNRSSYDALAIATHGRSGLSRLVLGSVAEQVVRATNKPVLLYRPRLVRLPDAHLAQTFRVYD